jgi:hypothetical protein
VVTGRPWHDPPSDGDGRWWTGAGTDAGPGEQYRAAMMGMGGLGRDGRRRQRLVAGLVVAAMLLTVGAVLLGSVL